VTPLSRTSGATPVAKQAALVSYSAIGWSPGSAMVSRVGSSGFQIGPMPSKRRALGVALTTSIRAAQATGRRAKTSAPPRESKRRPASREEADRGRGPLDAWDDARLRLVRQRQGDQARHCQAAHADQGPEGEADHGQGHREADRLHDGLEDVGADRQGQVALDPRAHECAATGLSSAARRVES
jgi:hypothetical protein